MRRQWYPHTNVSISIQYPAIQGKDQYPSGSMYPCTTRVPQLEHAHQPAAVRIYNKGMRAVHTFCALALTTQSFPRAPFTLAGPPLGPINHHNTPDTGIALHNAPRPTCVRTLTFPHLSARGAFTALEARATLPCNTDHHSPRKHITCPALSACLPAPPNTAKLLSRPLVPFIY